MKLLMKKAVKAAVFTALTTLALTAFASAEGEIAISAGCTTGTSLRLRSEPNTSASIVTTLNKSMAVALLDTSTPGWYKVDYNGNTGYVSSDYIAIDQDNLFTTYGRVPEGTVHVRAGASTDSASLATISAGTIVTVNGLVNGWYDVTCQYGTEGYIRSDLLVLTSNPTSSKGSSIVETAMKHLGTIGDVVYIKLSLDEIERRLNNIKTRGIAMKPGETLADLYNMRVPLYEKYADITIETEGMGIEESIEVLIEKLK